MSNLWFIVLNLNIVFYNIFFKKQIKMKRSNSNNTNIINNKNNEIPEKKRNKKSISLTKDDNRYNNSLNQNNYNALYTFNQKNQEKEHNNLFSELSN